MDCYIAVRFTWLCGYVCFGWEGVDETYGCLLVQEETEGDVWVEARA